MGCMSGRNWLSCTWQSFKVEVKRNFDALRFFAPLTVLRHKSHRPSRSAGSPRARPIEKMAQGSRKESLRFTTSSNLPLGEDRVDAASVAGQSLYRVKALIPETHRTGGVGA